MWPNGGTDADWTVWPARASGGWGPPSDCGARGVGDKPTICKERGTVGNKRSKLKESAHLKCVRMKWLMNRKTSDTMEQKKMITMTATSTGDWLGNSSDSAYSGCLMEHKGLSQLDPVRQCSRVWEWSCTRCSWSSCWPTRHWSHSRGTQWLLHGRLEKDESR